MNHIKSSSKQHWVVWNSFQIPHLKQNQTHMYSVPFFLNTFFTIIVVLLGKYESDYTIEFTVAKESK